MRYYFEELPTPLERVQALAEHLNLLALRVREAVAHAVSETVARLAHDATNQLMDRLANPADDPDDFDDDDWQTSSRAIVGRTADKPMSAEQRQSIDRAIAAGLAIAGWLLRRGRPWTALGMGTVVAAAVATGSRVTRRGLNMTGTLAELISLAVPLSRNATRGN